MNKHKQLSKSERSEIMILRDKGYSMRAIAKVLGRSPNTISYEIKSNSEKDTYVAKRASQKSHHRKRMAKFQWKKLNQDDNLRNYVISKLKEGWNPDEIAGNLRKGKDSYISKTAIYEWLRSSRGNKYCKYLYSQRYEVKKRKQKKTKRDMIPYRISIWRRPKGSSNRTRYGHWEEDTVVSSRNGKGALSVMIERRSRYVVIRKLAGMNASKHNQAIKQTITSNKVLSVTFDNGIENKHHYKLGIPTFFCDPYSSWQKGSVENVNKMIRQYIPKGSDISKFSDEYIAWIQNRINKKPRKILGYRSSEEVAIMGGVLKVKGECPN